MTFFELRTPRDMLDKAERELGRFRNEFTIDNAFNFFITAYHVQDYIRVTNAVPQFDLDTFLHDPDIKACRDLCDKGKHLKLTQRPDPTAIISTWSTSGGPPGEPQSSSGVQWDLCYSDRVVDVHKLPERIVYKWRKFLDQHGL